MTFLYNGLGILVSVLAGMAIQKLKLERSVNPVFLQYKTRQDAIKENGGGKVPLAKNRYLAAGRAAYHQRDFSIHWFGVGIWRVDPIRARKFVENNLSAADWWGVPLATILGLPLYANSVGVLPIVEALAGRGVPLEHGAGVYDRHGYLVNSRIADIEESDGLETAFGVCRDNQHRHYDNGLFL